MRGLSIAPIGGVGPARAVSQEPAEAQAGAGVVDPVGALRFESVLRGDSAEQASDQLGEWFDGAGFVIDYRFTADKPSAAHAFVFRKLRFYVKFDEGRLRIKSKRDGFDTIEQPIVGWHARDQENVVQLKLSGTTLSVGVNQERVESWEVLDEDRKLNGKTSWKIEVDAGRITDLVVRSAD